MKPIPLPMKREMEADPFYKNCIRRVMLQDHECRPCPATGRLIEWEHAMMYAGQQVNEKAFIIPICWYVHRGPGLKKEINEWIALNRASDDLLIQYSKAVDLIAKRERLNKKYGDAKILRGK